MKKILLTILCLAFASLACLSTSSAAVESSQLVIVATRSEKTQAIAEPVDIVGQVPTLTPPVCAVVVADDALHLRSGPSENDIVLTWLRSGAVVQVLSRSYADWWRVQLGDDIGFARSSFLEVVRCGND